MKFKATVILTLKESVLDSQAAAVERLLSSHGGQKLQSVRMGKIIELILEETSLEKAEIQAKEWAEKFLLNSVMEDYTVDVEKIL